MNIEYFEIQWPFDAHVHFRDEETLTYSVSHTALQFGAAVVMPNLNPPVTTAKMAEEYQSRILKARPLTASRFQPYMTIYLTDQTSPEIIADAKTSHAVIAAKLYPANATTGSAAGVSDIKKLSPVFKKMEEVDLVLCVHGETLVSKDWGDRTRGDKVGHLRREEVFLKEILHWLVAEFPKLRIVLEHISTKEAVDFVESSRDGVVATITAHHLLATVDDVFDSHHNKCMPMPKEWVHRQALLDAATSGSPKFFCGTDSAPHSESSKNTHCGCAGCFTGLHSVELYATAFEERKSLHMLEGFMSSFGRAFYGLPTCHRKLRIERKTWTIPDNLPYTDNQTIVPFWAGRELRWKSKQV